jgi:hypothetical protein
MLMSDLSVEISGFVAGDDLEIRRTVTDLLAPIEIAWLTVKHHPGQPDEEARLQKRITPTDIPGTGYITDIGGVDIDGDLRFDLTQADTSGLGSRKYVYDIQIRLTSGMVYTIEKGTIQLEADVTKGTA